jgi:ubiquinone/menaquinone biosynthesis C-methylase UbiE
LNDHDRRQARKVVRHYTRLAPKYDRNWDRYTRGSLGKLVERLELSGSERVLDVACGTGRLEAMLRETHPDIDVTGVDLSPDMLTVARQRLPEDARTRWLHGTLDAVELPPGSFDLVTCNNAFHLFPEQQASLHHMAALARPGGLVALIDWCREYPQLAVLQLLVNAGVGQRRRILTRKELGGMLRKAGLELTREERFSATPFWGMMCMMARRPEKSPP